MIPLTRALEVVGLISLRSLVSPYRVGDRGSAFTIFELASR